MNSAKIIQVIETISVRGEGVPEDPTRHVTEYWAPDGTKLAVRDAWGDKMLAELCNAAENYIKAANRTDIPTAQNDLASAIRSVRNLDQ